MKTILIILSSFFLGQGYCQDTIAFIFNDRIEFNNDLDKLNAETSYKYTKNMLGRPDSSAYNWESFDFGGPRVFKRFWYLVYPDLNVTVKHTKTTRRRWFRPLPNNAKLSCLTIDNGIFLTENSIICIGKTTKSEAENILSSHFKAKVGENEITFTVENSSVRLIFNEERTLELIEVTYRNETKAYNYS